MWIKKLKKKQVYQSQKFLKRRERTTLEKLKKKNKSKLELIINISSNAGSIYHNKDGNAYIYRTSKSALNSITKNLSIDLNKKFGTTVFAIDPGNTKSGMNPGGYIETDNCAKLIIDLITTNSELNGKFVNLLGKEILW